MKLLNVFPAMAILAMIGMFAYWADSPTEDIISVPVVVVSAQGTDSLDTGTRGAFKYTSREHTLKRGSTVQLADGSQGYASGPFSSDSGNCKVGQTAIANVRIGIYTHKLWKVLHVDCD